MRVRRRDRPGRAYAGLLAMLVASLGACAPEHAPNEARADRSPCVVRRLSDGDSFECRDGRRVRLLLVDAPELAQRGLGDAARAHLATLLPRGDTAWLEFDVTPQDPYGRWLAYAWRGDTLVNEVMAADGYAVLLRYENVRHLARIERAVDAARRERRGLWAQDGFRCRPVDFRGGRCAS